MSLFDQSGRADGWFVLKTANKQSQLLGPFSEVELVDQLHLGRIDWNDLTAPSRSSRDWKRMSTRHELIEFAKSKFTDPGWIQRSNEFLTADSLVFPPFSDDPIYIQAQGIELGPLSFSEIISLFEKKSYIGSLYVWQVGWNHWYPILDLMILALLAETEEKARKSNSPLLKPSNRRGERIAIAAVVPPNARQFQRDALAATVHMMFPSLDASKVSELRVVGICNDVSESGMQMIWNSHFPIRDAGDELEIKMCPVTSSGIPAFNSKVRVMWSNPVQGHLGVKFLQMDKDVQLKLAKYTNKRGEKTAE